MSDAYLSKWISENQNDLLNDLTQLIALPSISKKSSNPAYPCGKGCAKALDFALSLAQSFGLETINYDYYCGSAILRGRTDKKIGIFVHLDTAPVSGMWLTDPLCAVIKNGYIIGCGVQDNKGAAVSLIYLLKYLKHEKKLDHTIELVFGCAKKPGMEDMDHYLSVASAPQLCLVADADFPVCIQEKGNAYFSLTCDFDDNYIEDFHAGYDVNAIPDMAFALLKNVGYYSLREKTKDIPNCSVIPAGHFTKLSMTTKGGHSAFPVDRTSPIPLLAGLLLDLGLASHAKPILAFLSETYAGCDGAPFGLLDDLQLSEATTHICAKTAVSEGKFEQILNVRYSGVHSADEVIQKVQQTAKENGFECRLLSNVDPWTPDPFPASLASLLTGIANKQLKTNLLPYTMGGTTYAHKLPNAIAFGPNRIRHSFPSYYGIGHMANEAILIQDLMELIKIYAATLNEIDTMF